MAVREDLLEQTAAAEVGARTTVQLLSLLRSRGVQLWAEGEKLLYSAPPGALPTELLAELKERKNDLLGFLRQGFVARRSGAPSRIEAVRRERPPLSFAQQRLWFLHQLRPESVEYNIARAVRLRGRVRVELLAASLEEIVRRHGSLRTTFAVEEGQPVQVVAPVLELALPLVDLAALPAGRREAEAWRLSQEDARRPFNLARGPLLRVFLLRLEAEDYIAPSTMHHVIGDGWSSGILFREMGIVYGALRRGEPPVLPELPVQYADFAVWQRQWLSGEVLEEQLGYWKQHLAGAPPELALPTDRPRSSVHEAGAEGGDRRELLIPRPLVESLRDFSQAQGATLFMILLAVWKVLLCRLCGQDDVVVGSPIANRNRTEIEGLIGCFVNTLVLRTIFSGNPSFRKVLASVRHATLGAFAHQDLPFEKLVEELHPERRLTQTPLFQVIFTLQNVPSPEMGVADFRMNLLPPTGQAATFDLACNLKEMQEGVHTSLMYKEGLFDGATIARMGGCYLRLLAALADDPGLKIRDLSLLSACEDQQLLREWNDMAGCPRPESGLYELIAAQAARTPEAVAVVAGEEQVSYQELAARAERLAVRLRWLGVRPEVLVGLAAERSVEMVVGILGTLAAGGAYVPLEPSHPRERLEMMLDDTTAPVLLVEGRLTEQLPGRAGMTIVGLKAHAGDPEAPSVAAGELAGGGRRWTSVWDESPAYVIFTSGSTGRPKGAANTQAGVRNRLLWMQEAYGLSPEDVVLQKTPFGFDVSVWEFLWPLMVGARLVMARPGGHQDPVYLRRLIARDEVTTLHFVPSMLHLFLDQEGLAECRSIRQLMSSGEALPAELARRCFARLPWVKLHNLYGPTEAAIDVSAWRCEPGGVREPLPIGRPIANLRLQVLDRELRPVPVGVAGELYIGGVGLARGYWQRPELTAERFVPEPLSGEPGGRLYRTGDLARWRSPGEVEYLGRMDLQVKVRGVRIELGEIEAALLARPGVREAVVLLRGELAADRQLVAYVVPSSSSLEPLVLRGELRRVLPEVMVPQAVVFLPALPLTANGKVDRNALPRPEPGPSAAKGYLPPRSAIERTLAGIWRRLLHAQRVGREDNFFDLGGHSLLLVEVQSSIRRELGVELSVLELFQHPTVAALARLLRREAGEGEHSLASKVPASREAPGAQAGIAVVAMAGRFPGAKDIEGFWENLRAGVESIQTFSHDEMRAEGVEETELARPDWVPAGGVLEGIELFDAPFFGFNPREAEMLDPQQRLFLECGWEALERAGYGPGGEALAAAGSSGRPGEGDYAKLQPRVGVFASASTSTYALLNLSSQAGLVASVGRYQTMLGNDKDYLATRVSYCLGLMGPSLSVQTGCSSSLVAVALACQALADGQCEMALAGGASIEAQQRAGYLYQPGHVLSPDGHCRAFDARAGGTVGGSGVGVVVLKPLSAALAAGDRVLAVIKGWAINNDGSRKIGFTAPSVEGQAEAIAAAQAAAGIAPASVGYVETHGTGTALGDPIEVAGLLRAFAARTGERLPAGSCALGSVKTNIGHLDAAAGVAGLIKTVLALKHREIPPSLHFETPNPQIDFGAGPFYVNTRLRRWEEARWPRRAGVSSFGIGGTNAHLVLEEAPAPAAGYAVSGEGDRRGSRTLQLLVVSARTPAALEAATDRLAKSLEILEADAGEAAARPEAVLADVAHTLAVGRRGFGCRRTVVASDLATARQALAGRSERLREGGEEAEAMRRPVVFLFPGQGAQYAGMGGEIYRLEQVFRQEVDRCAELLAEPLGLDLRRLLFPEPAEREEAEARLRETRLTQPALFTVDYALARLWMSWGVRPEGMLGHSVGEYVAATIAGVMALPDALSLVAARGRIVGSLPPGAMLSVALGEEEVEPKLGGELWLAAVNGPRQTVIAGGEQAVVALASSLAAEGIESRRLRTSHAFHSGLLDPVLAPFRALVSGIKLRAPRLPFVSNVTGDWIRPDEATDPDYWMAHLRRTVRFGVGLARVLEEPEAALLEVGPGRALGTLARQQPEAVGRLVVSSLPRSRPERGGSGELEALLDALARLWSSGVTVSWRGFYSGERRRRMDLPTYPFERRRYWIEPRRERREAATSAPVEAPGVTPGAEEAPPPAAVSLHARPRLGTRFVAPRNLLERAMSSAWEGLLGIDGIGIHDDFFELGGHSLLATQVLSRVREAFAVELPLRALFDAPTVAELAAAVAAARSGSEAESALVPVAPVPRDGPLPLSFAQERMWFLHRFAPQSDAYNISLTLSLEGGLQREVAARSLSEIVRRHEVLRTVFAEASNGPVQEIGQAAAVALPVCDLSSLPNERREPEARRLTVAEASRPFDLLHGPVLRALLVRLAERRHIATLTLHHIATDSWSMGILVRELCTLYRALAMGEPSPLAELPVQYADYAAWQRRWLAGPALERQLAYWRQRLGVDPPPLDLPADRPRSRDRSWGGGVRRFVLAPTLAERLNRFSRERSVSLFMTLLAGWKALLSRVSGESVIRVGTPVANRRGVEIEELIGFFVNTLVLATDVAGGTLPFTELLDRVRETSLEAQAHQDAPFDRLVEELVRERDLSRSPLFQVFFVLQNAPGASAELPDLVLTQLPGEARTAMFDLSLQLEEGSAGLAAQLDYSTDLFDAATGERLAGHFESLLAAVTATPEAEISELPLLSAAETQQLLREWNDTARGANPEVGLYELIAAQAGRAPEAVAVVCGEEQVTYRELVARAERLAARLRQLGVGPEVLVGLMAERSVAMMVGVLGTLAAGGAYVPLDPGYPRERLEMMLSDSAAPVLLVKGRLRETLQVPEGVAAIDLTESADGGDWARLWRESTAYVIYTSGSTGRPKGVRVSQGALLNFLASMGEQPGLGADDVMLALTSLSFDIAGLELFLPLLVGARIELVEREVAADGQRLAERLAASGATVAQATPATWRMLVESGWKGDRRLKALCGGEALAERLATELLARVGELWNLYGPTETTVWSALALLAADEPVRLGTPVARTELYLLDPALEPVPLGTAGEVFIGGAGVARGYHVRPALTAERFLPDPWGEVPGSRLYRTGDLARRDGRGRIEFLGRIDHQVKVRGFRIELGEIEASLAAQPEVAQAVVAAQGEGAERRLVAYLVARGGPVPADRELRERLRRVLPDSMLPSAYLVLERLPLTPNGKVDRKALPVLDAVAGNAEQVAPRGPIEELLAGIWADVLRRERVGGSDNFFELGGHSLLATQVVSRVRQALGVELPLRSLFASPLLGDLAREVEELRRAGEGPALPPITREPRGATAPLSFAQERMWFLHQLDPGTAAYNLALAVRLRGRLDQAVLARCFSEVVRRHEALRTRFASATGGPVQIVQPPNPFELSAIDLASLPPALSQAEALRLSAHVASQPFDLERGPLLRANLLVLALPGAELSAAEYALMVTMHHIVSDGWSMGVLVSELAALYAAFSSGAPSPLPELPVQYPDFALWQRRHLSVEEGGERLAAELGFWRGQLGGSPPVLALPADRRRGEAEGFQTGWVERGLPHSLLARLHALARGRSVSLYMVLLAAWKALLLRWSGEEDLLVGAPIANRNRAEIERLIGFFLNTLLLRTRLDGVADFDGLLARVREVCLATFAHQDLPLARVLQAAFPEHDPGRGSPHQVMFLLQNVAPLELQGPGLVFSSFDFERRREDLGSNIFELALALSEPRREAAGAPLEAGITFNALLFDAATIERLLARYERLLSAVAMDPSCDLWAYPLLEDGDERQLLFAGGAEEAPVAAAPPVHRRISQHAAVAPGMPAVLTAAGESTTYAELVSRANRVAQYLRALGLGPDRVAGVALDRSPGLVVALLAVLQAGGAYLPLDPSAPDERLADLLTDAGAALVVTTRTVLDARPGLASAGLPVVCLDEKEEAIRACPDAAPRVEVDGESLAYVIYTSGSTGRPKGVMVTHAALANYVEAVLGDYGIGPGDRVLQFASVSFDTSAEEIFPTLAGGATLVLRDEEMLASAAGFLESCDKQGISILDLPTAYWHELLAERSGLAPALPAALRLVLIGGERAAPERLASWRAWAGEGIRLVNTYGPTETTIVATRADLTAAPLPGGEVPIGRPVRGARAYVLDRRGVLAPEGFPGDLFLAGAGVARGYRGRPDLTAERFLPDPWSARPGSRMYQSGDMARWLPVGELEFLGRADQQVKIRGYRVEPAEIEAALAAHPAVAQAAVVAREDGPGGRRLVGYWASAAGESLGAGELRSFLSRRLPDYMLPAAWVELPALPLTPSGKIDRHSLPAPQGLRPEVAASYLAPRSAVEETVAAVWSEVLGLDGIGARDNFFELGGHSLLLPLVLHRLEIAFGVAVPLRSLVDEPTVEGQALAIEELLLDQIERSGQETRDPRDGLLPRQIAAQAARRGQAAAVVDGSGPLSYEELMRRVRQVAGRLRRIGVGPGVVVAVLAERSSWMVAGLLGVLESGGAYLPLDPAYPVERLAWLLADSGAAVVLGDDGPLDRLERQAPGMCGARRLRLAQAGDGEDGAERAPEAGPEDLAYVIYTSGSTGRPKGVEITHGSLANLVAAEIEVCGLTPGIRALQFAPIGFDSSVWEIFAPLASGAELHVGTREELAPGPPLAHFLRSRRIQVATFVPSVIAALETGLGGETPAAALPELGTLIAGGEACSAALAARWSAGRRFLNVYGPTEATVVASTEEGFLPGRVYGIGRALPNLRLYVLDPAGEPAATGAEGEIAIGGIGVARGYRRRPEQTAERFVPDPWGEPGSRLYLSGDLGRWLADGRMEYRGRIDDQLKIRGHRIEPKEVEEALRRHPQVQDAAVVAGEIAEAKVLVAYVVGRGGVKPVAGELRDHLRGLLPEPMVPAAFVSLPVLPLTANNKVDRRALAAAAATVGSAATAPGAGRQPRTAPAGAAEEAVAAIWREVFHREGIGAEDDFFELGGHSLLATQVLARVENRLGLALPQRVLFDRPVLRELAREIQGRLADRGNQREATAAPALTEAAGPAPLSSGQRRLWFLDRLLPGSPVYNLVVPLRLDGEIAPAVLERALAAVVARHEALRTTFGESGGEPWQRVHPPASVPLPWIDLREVNDGELRRLTRTEARRPFDLTQGPLLRALRATNGREDLLLLFVHHIVFDGWSAHVLEAELAALISGGPDLPPLPIRYRDYARRQQEWLRSPERSAELAWWRARLEGAPQQLELPTDRPRPARQSHRGAIRRRLLPPELVARLREAGRGGITLFNQLFAGFAALLARLGGGGDLSIGTPVANRGQVELEGLVGFLVNTLVLRVDLAGDPDWRELLGRARETALGAFAHQELPFELLVEELRPDRDLSRSPLVQAVLVLQGASQPVPAGRLRLDPRTVDTGTAKFDLTLFVEEAEGIELALEYATDLFDPATADRWLGYFVTLLAAAVAEPELAVGALPLLAAGERHQLVVDWNDSATCFPRESLVHELVAEQARRRPEAVALEWGDAVVRYGELLERAGGLARELLALGLVAEEPVVIAVERSPALIVALLAVLAAGGTYVPLDPDSPAERLSWMIGDTGARLALVDGEWRPRLQQAAPAGLILHQVDGARSGSLPLARVAPLSLACVLYTSGTTGRPKGVAISHRGVARLVRETHWARLGPEEVWLQLAPIPFDVSTMEIWGALCNGSRLVLFPGAKASLAEIGAVVERHGVTTLFLTAGLFHEVVEHEIEALAPVRQLLSGGDVVSAPHVRKALAARPGRLVVDVYGPTENTTATSCYLARQDSGFGETMPVGRPIANTRVHVLDAQLRPVPAGVVGELYTGGDGLARGYLGRPELTAERFVPDPFGQPGERLYRTGDQARVMASGEVEFLGRLDAQVKIRGHRVEPGEVEAVLAEHPAIGQVVVMAWPPASRATPGPVERRLVAWWVPRGDEGAPPPPTADELRAFLRDRLPAPMVPASWVRLERLPLTANGKVDRNALPAPADGEPGTGEAARLAPGTPVEELLAGIWADLLGRERIGREDHFFDLGGHSLLATRLVSRIRSALGVELPLATIFAAPTLELLGEAVTAARQEDPGPSLPPIVAASRQPAPPLSFAQRRLWFLDQMTPGLPVYNIPVPLRIAGPLDRRALGAAIGEVVRRHEALRTGFHVEPGGEEPYQSIHPVSSESGLPLVDLSGLPSPLARAEARRELRRDASQPFDMGAVAAAPLMRAALLSVGREEHLLLATFHHAVFDGWSLAVMRRELTVLYEAFAAGRPSPLPEPAIQYADFALWQRRYLEGEGLSSQLRFWRERLAGAPAVLELPADRPRPAVQSFRGATLEVEPPPALAGALARSCRRQAVTRFMVLLAAFQALLARISGQEDLLVGTPVAGRNRAEVEPLIGFFANTLVLRGRPASSLAFADLLRQARETALSAFAHQDLPFDTLVEELRPARDLSRNPLIQVVLGLPGPAEEPVSSPPGIEFNPIAPAELGMTISKFDLTLAAVGSGEELRCGLEFAVDLFDAATAERWLSHFVELLAGALAEPDLAVGELPLLSAAERHQLRAEWNDSVTPYPRSSLIHELVEEWARRAPEAVAIERGEETLLYRELCERAEGLAAVLAQRGLEPEDRVVVAVERSPSLVVALLGVLMAGGAYVPLDADSPAERLGWMIQDTGARLAVVDRKWRERLREVPVTSVEGLELIGAETVQPGRRGPAAPPAPESLAYVTYTSGTTGLPKGVAVPHRAVVRLVRETGYARLAAEEVFLQVAPVAFDASTAEIWGALCNGSRLVLFPEEKPSLAELGRVLARHRVTTLFLTSGLFHEMVENEVAALRPVRQLLTGGDVVSAAHVRRALAANPDLLVVHAYGPTENTTFTCCYAARQDAGFGDTLPLGRPIANTQMHVVDAAMRPVPVGVFGELFAAGEGLARGYLGKPELTAERFVPDPFGGHGERLYRTGDLVRRLPSGELEFLGRLDAQVKIRGNRVEPGEVEAALATHPGIAQVVVMAWPPASGRPVERRLVAWWVAHDGEGPEAAPPPATAELRSFLRRRLPEPMVPSRWIRLPKLPLTANGKVDRRALTVPEEGGDGEGTFTAPRTPVEELIAGIWADLLRRERIGRDDHFFDLGGHSLLATRLVSRLRSTLGVELPLRHVFEAPTVAELARLVEAAGRGAAVPGLPAILPRPRSDPAQVSFAQQRFWYMDRLEAGSPVFNIPAPLELSGPLDPVALAGALSEIVRRHEALRTVFAAPRGEPLQTVLPPPAASTLAFIDLSALPADRRRDTAVELAEREGRRGFDLARGPLLRTALLRLAPEDHLLLLTLHHIVADGWSTELLRRELVALYAAFQRRLPSPLAEPPLQYADYALWQRSWLSGEGLERLLDQWRGHFGERGVPQLRLPVDRPQGSGAAGAAGSYRQRMLPGELAAGARALGRSAGATQFMVLLAAFDALLHRLGGGDTVAVGTPVAGRGTIELEGVMGCFVNTLVLPVHCGGDPTFIGLLERVRETALTAYALQDLPFERLVDALKPQRERGATPLFRVMFALQNELGEAPEAADLRFSPLVLGNGTSQFDLTLYLAERDGALIAWMEYRTALFDASTVERLLDAYERLLAAAVAAPVTPLSGLPAPEDLARRGEGAPAAPVPDGRTALTARHERITARRAGLTSGKRAALEQLRRGEAAGTIERSRAGSVLVEITPAAAGLPPLFCVHGAGGDAQCFFPLARRLGSGQPCYGLQAIGLAPGQEPLSSVEEMAALYVEAVRSVQPRGPYLLAGWSFGGVAAFEMAQQLRAAGEEVGLLAILDSPAGLPEPGASPNQAAMADQGLAPLLLDMAAYAGRFWGRDLGLRAADLEGLGPEQQLEHFAARARAAGLFHRAGDLAQVRRVVAVLQANLAASRRYRGRAYDADLTLVTAEHGPLAGELDPGWQRLASTTCWVSPGNHLTMLAEPHVASLAERLGTAIAQSLRPGGGAGWQ